MGGNDQLDAILSHYSVYIRSKRWTVRIASWAIDVVICMSYLNARLLKVPLATKKHGHVNWILSLINDLIKKANQNTLNNDSQINENDDFSDGDISEPPRKKSKHSDNALHLSTNPPHFPKRLERNKRKNCVLCYQNTQNYKKTYFECDQCGVGLCIDSCFKIYHTKTAL